MTVDETIRSRPPSLTFARAKSFLPTMDICPEWCRKSDAGELPDGPAGMFGMLRQNWPDSKPTREEAEWILSLLEFGTWRWMSCIVCGDSNQITAMELIEAANGVLGES